MNLVDRIAQAEQTFELKKNEREDHLAKASECAEEMNKLQGEWRVLNELLAAEKAKKPNKKAAVIEAES